MTVCGAAAAGAAIEHHDDATELEVEERDTKQKMSVNEPERKLRKVQPGPFQRPGHPGCSMLRCVFGILVALVKCSDSFNLVMSPFTNPSYEQNLNSVSMNAKKINTIGGTLKPSNKVQNKLVFENFIINPNLDQISELSADINYQALNPSIFTPLDPEFYKDESDFGVALFQQRLQPMLENAQVLILIRCLISYLGFCIELNSLADRSWMLYL